MNLIEKNDAMWWIKVVSGSVIATIGTYLVWRKSGKRKSRKEYPKDTVILHQYGRAPYAPSMSPFAIKLETYLRMAKIPYMNVHSRVRSEKGKFPWIEYNDESIADTQFCIEYLNKTLAIDLNKNFSKAERGIARSFLKMLEENTYWALLLERWILDPELAICKIIKLPYRIAWFIRRRLKRDAYGHGIGRHSQDEIYHIMDLDLMALSDFLGDKKFLLGERPCEEDCAIFGQLAEWYWQSFGHRSGPVIKNYKNLCDYCERMKETFWPDWDECNSNGTKKEATK
ncbi:Failed axon connections homolog [Mytilus coruscus]|uniref:Failed axon connections homolog n=1 Tax=Mytilus coruscus TaxID=42192 RepID=A0A6J7ZZX9_MYTCO|nr:Failed axon connections homolog [Mytilus coruscus]